MIVGIDNGLDGGIVALSDVPGLPPIAMIPMPTYERKRRAKGKDKKPRLEREVDTTGLLNFLIKVCFAKNDGSTIFYVEQAPRHAPNANSLRVMSFTYGKIIAILECAFPKAPCFRVRCGNDLDGWQRAMLPNAMPKGSKEAAMKLAKTLWPEETWLASDKCRKPHDGMIDGALIAHWGLCQTLGIAVPSLKDQP